LIGTGSAITHLYLYSVRVNSPFDIQLLFFGVFSLSIGAVLLVLPYLFHSEVTVSKEFFILCVIALSFSVNYMYVSRFPIPFNTDSSKEYVAAYVTRDSWNPELLVIQPPPEEKGYFGGMLSFRDYIGCLSVTILPTVASKITGLSLFNIFSLFYPAIVSILPLAFFVLIRRFFKDNALTYLSTVLIPLYLVFNYGFMRNFRSSVSIYILYLVLFCSTVGGNVRWTIMILLSFGAISGHQTVGYFGALLIASLILYKMLQRLLRRFNSRASIAELFKPHFLFAYLAILLGWMVYVQWYECVGHTERLLNYFLEVFRRPSISREAGYIVSSRRGWILTAWFDLEFLLIGLGCLMGLYGFVKGNLDELKSAWVLCGCNVIVYILLSVFLRATFNPYMEPNRALIYSVPFSMSFLALLLIKIGRSHLRVLALLFVALMIPMNMLLPSHDTDLMFHPESELPIGIAAAWSTNFALREARYAAANWIFDKVGEYEFIQVDSVSYGVLNFVPFSSNRLERYRPPELISEMESRERGWRTIRHLVVSDLYLKHGMWYQLRTDETTVITFCDPKILLENTLANLVYNDLSLALFLSNEV